MKNVCVHNVVMFSIMKSKEILGLENSTSRSRNYLRFGKNCMQLQNGFMKFASFYACTHATIGLETLCFLVVFAIYMHVCMYMHSLTGLPLTCSFKIYFWYVARIVIVAVIK